MAATTVTTLDEGFTRIDSQAARDVFPSVAFCTVLDQQRSDLRLKKLVTRSVRMDGWRHETRNDRNGTQDGPMEIQTHVLDHRRNRELNEQAIVDLAGQTL